MMFELKSLSESVDNLGSDNLGIKNKAHSELANIIVVALINNNVPVLEIDNILCRAIRIHNKQKLRRTMMNNQSHCTVCGSVKKLELHHIKPQRDYPELQYELDNIMLVCKDCHDIYHNRANKKFYNAEEYRENFKHERKLLVCMEGK